MFTTDLKNTITQIVDTFLDRNWVEIDRKIYSIKRKALLFRLNFEVYDPENMERIEQENALLVFTGNTSVFYITESEAKVNGVKYFDYGNIPNCLWVNSSNHDSCWRNDGLNWITGLYFDMCEIVNSDKAPIELESSARFGFGYICTDLIVETKTKSGDNYRKEIASIKPV